MLHLLLRWHLCLAQHRCTAHRPAGTLWLHLCSTGRPLLLCHTLLWPLALPCRRLWLPELLRHRWLPVLLLHR